MATRAISSGRAGLVSSSPRTTVPGSLPRHCARHTVVVGRIHATQTEWKQGGLSRIFSGSGCDKGISPEKKKPWKEENGWVNKLVMWSLAPADRKIAITLLDSGKGWSKYTNLFLIMAPCWLLPCWIGNGHLPTGEEGEFIVMIKWIVPITFMFFAIFPYSNSIQRATNPYALGAGHVPFFSTLPVSIRCLLRISQRVTIIRGIIFGILATMFLWGLAMLNNQAEAASGLLGGIPAFTIVWCFSRPVFIWHRIQAATKCRRGMFFIRCATASVEVILFFLWLLAGFCGVITAYIWALEKSSLLLIPASIGGIILSALFSRVLLEIAINEIRHRRYDWVAKPE